MKRQNFFAFQWERVTCWVQNALLLVSEATELLLLVTAALLTMYKCHLRTLSFQLKYKFTFYDYRGIFKDFSTPTSVLSLRYGVFDLTQMTLVVMFRHSKLHSSELSIMFPCSNRFKTIASGSIPILFCS